MRNNKSMPKERKARNKETVEAFEKRMWEWMTRGVEVEPAKLETEATYREPNVKEIAIIAIFCKRQDDTIPQDINHEAEADKQLEDILG